MGTHAEAIRTYFETQGVKLIPGESPDQYIARIAGMKRELMFATIIASDEEQNVAVRFWGLGQVTDTNRAAVLEAINQVNMTMRWCKLLIDADGDIIGAADAVVGPATIGPVTYEVFMRCAHILDDTAEILQDALA